MTGPARPFYRKKRFYIISALVLAALLIGFNFRTVKDQARTWSQELVAYAESTGPLTSGLILGLVGVADSSFLSLPEGNDFLVVYFSILKPYSMPWLVLASALGSLAGSLLLFSVGRRGGNALLQKRFSPERVQRIEAWFKKFGVWAILIPCIIPPPMPFKLFVLTAGVLQYRYSRFIFATLGGRLIRYGIWGILAVLFKDLIKQFMKQYLLELGILILGLLLLAGLVSYSINYSRKRNRRQAGLSTPARNDN